MLTKIIKKTCIFLNIFWIQMQQIALCTLQHVQLSQGMSLQCSRDKRTVTLLMSQSPINRHTPVTHWLVHKLHPVQWHSGWNFGPLIIPDGVPEFQSTHWKQGIYKCSLGTTTWNMALTGNHVSHWIYVCSLLLEVNYKPLKRGFYQSIPQTVGLNKLVHVKFT